MAARQAAFARGARVGRAGASLARGPGRAARCAPLASLSRAGKEAAVKECDALLEGASLVAAITYDGMTVAQMQDLRRSLPEDATLYVVKNSLMLRAAQDTPFASISEHTAKGMNAYLVCGEEIAPSIKVVLDKAKELKKEGLESFGFVGGAMEGNPLTGKEVAKLKDLPTKTELITKIAFSTKQITTKVAYGTKAIATKVAYGVKAIADGESDLINE